MKYTKPKMEVLTIGVLNMKIKMKFSKNVFNYLFAIIVPMFAMLMTERIWRMDFQQVFDWALNNKGEFFLNYLLLFGLVNAFFVLHKKAYIGISFIILFISFIGSLINRIKFQFRGEPLLPQDLKLGKEATDISVYLDGAISFKMVLFFILLLILFAILIWKWPKAKENKIISASISIVSVFIVFSIYSNKPIPLTEFANVAVNPWNQQIHFQQNGFVLGFSLDLKWLKVEEPKNYRKEEIYSIIESIESRKNESDQIKPNVIFIMSEAFWDPTLLEEIDFSEDPIPFFRELQHDYTNGYIITPLYGGGTANTEFEVLTGFSTSILPVGTIAYKHYIDKPIHSLASIYAANGYKSTAIHTYHNWFYQRNEAYKYLGFHNFISAEFFNSPEYKRGYIADSEITKRILSEIEKSNTPDFIFAVTMQNHGPYFADNNDKTITVQGNLSSEAKEILEIYANILKDVDQSLKELIEGIDKLNEPTIVVFFGDHLPGLGQNYQVYREANFFDNEYSYEGYLKTHSVPFVIWDNFSNQKEEFTITPNFLGQYVLELSKQRGTVYTDFLHELFWSGFRLTPNMNYLNEANVSMEDLETYRLLQYDQMFGKGYIYKYMAKPTVQENYFLGSEPITIESTTPVKKTNGKNNTDDETIIKGSGFVEKIKVFVDNNPVETTFIDENTLKAVIPEKYRKKQGHVNIQVQVIDSQGNPLSMAIEHQVEVLE